jgi:CLASP N terminal
LSCSVLFASSHVLLRVLALCLRPSVPHSPTRCIVREQQHTLTLCYTHRTLQDGGGIGTDGSLPEAQPLYVSSERDLVVEMERLTATLSGGAASTDWEKRCAPCMTAAAAAAAVTTSNAAEDIGGTRCPPTLCTACLPACLPAASHDVFLARATACLLCVCSVGALLRLEGLVKGGAAGSYEETFLELLRSLRDPLLEQLADRRSAVSRQAAHTMIALAASLGQRFEPYAAPFMTALFKMLVITVQVCAACSGRLGRSVGGGVYGADAVHCIAQVHARLMWGVKQGMYKCRVYGLHMASSCDVSHDNA